jgi:L-iditol 2-dehydrogenase
MDGKMKVAVMEAIGKIGYAERDIPAPKNGEALVKLEYVGICGSDLHYFHSGRIGGYVVQPPFVLGHEAAGTVVETAPDVTNVKKGDRVALEPGKTCGECEYCRGGLYNLCPDVVFFATPPVDGVFCEYVAHPAGLCFKLPDNVTALEGALIEPLAVGFHAARQGGARAGQTAAVFGAGCIGLSSMLALKAAGVERIYVADIERNRLAKALELGATATIDATHGDPAKTLMKLAGGGGCDLAIETSGAGAAAGWAVQTAKKAATIVFVGYSADGTMTLPMGAALDKELTFKTVFRYRHVYPEAIEAVAAGKINLKGIVTHTFAFDDLQTALDRSASERGAIVKAVVGIG